MAETIKVGMVVFLGVGSLGDFICDVHDSILIGHGEKPDHVLIAHEAYKPGESKILAVEEWPGEAISSQGDVFYPYKVLADTLLKSLRIDSISQAEYDIGIKVATRAYAENWSYTTGRANTSRFRRLLHK